VAFFENNSAQNMEESVVPPGPTLPGPIPPGPTRPAPMLPNPINPIELKPKFENFHGNVVISASTAKMRMVEVVGE